VTYRRQSTPVVVTIAPLRVALLELWHCVPLLMPAVARLRRNTDGRLAMLLPA
jgi:hypothetical protein